MSDKATLNVEGMTCTNCALSIERYLKKEGLSDVHVTFSTGEVTFENVGADRLPAIAEGINKLGYKVVHGVNDTAPGHQPLQKGRLSPIEKKFYISLIFTVPLFSHMFLPFHTLHNPIVQLLLCIPVYGLGLVYFGKSAWGSLKSGVPNMDVLITIGSSAAFFYSLTGTVLYYGTPEVGNYLFYETSATIISLVMLGNVLEHRSVRQTTTAIEELGRMQVTTARKYTGDNGDTIEVSYSNITKGDILLVNTGDKVPVDGRILQGNASLDESMISGESVPLDKKEGDTVIGGTIVIGGNIKMKAEKVGDETVLSHIIEMVKNAQRDKPAIQKLGDKVSAIFVPIVIGVALLTFLLSFLAFDITLQRALMNSIAVLVISCPCAMGLATPTAVMVGLGRAAKSGILIKGGSTLENFAKVKTVVFDKTGTITTGNFKIRKFEAVGVDNQYARSLLFQLEQHSSHPIAKSIVNEYREYKDVERNIFSDIHEEKGVGIHAKDKEGNTYLAGSYQVAAQLTADTSHSVYLLKNNSLIAVVDMEDEIKEDAADVIKALRKEGIRTILLSGDSELKVKEVGQKLGFDEAYGGKLPEEKLEMITRWSQKQEVAMVGDGINDAPALARATVGVSLSKATQVAIQTAQIVLLKGDDLLSVKKALKISRHTLRTIKQNLFWAFFYNVLAIPLAAVGMLNPMIAALTMAFSDVVVVGNSIRLKTKKLS